MVCYRAFLSKTFGKIISKINFPIKDSDITDKEIQFFSDNKGMILLTRRNWAFANLFIKGYWKHAARITDFNTIVEATGRGVIRNSVFERLRKSSNYKIVRPKNTSQVEEDAVSSKIEEYIGKEYDWSYDGDNDAFYCSELIYIGYMIILNDFPVEPKSEGCQEVLNPDELSNEKHFISFGTKKQIRGE